MSFSIYIVGFLIMIIGLAVGANLIGVAPRWIMVGVLVLVGLGVVLGVKNTRQRDPS